MTASPDAAINRRGPRTQPAARRRDHQRTTPRSVWRHNDSRSGVNVARSASRGEKALHAGTGRFIPFETLKEAS
jgi:hypothetical protein